MVFSWKSADERAGNSNVLDFEIFALHFTMYCALINVLKRKGVWTQMNPAIGTAGNVLCLPPYENT